MTRSSRSSRTCAARFGDSANALGSDVRRPARRGRAARVPPCLGGASCSSRSLPPSRTPGRPARTSSSAKRCIRSLQLLPPTVAELLSEFPYDFLYGSIAADTSIAKKYAPAGRHCHSWTVGMEILRQRAPSRSSARSGWATSRTSPPTPWRTTIFVPRQLAVTSSTSSLGHSYWESRFETHLGDRGRPARARADPHRPLALRRAARPGAEPDDLQHADQPPDLPRHGASSPTTSPGSGSFSC